MKGEEGMHERAGSVLRIMSECEGQMVGGSGADCCDAASALFLASNGVKLGLAIALRCEVPVVSVTRPG